MSFFKKFMQGNLICVRIVTHDSVDYISKTNLPHVSKGKIYHWTPPSIECRSGYWPTRSTFTLFIYNTRPPYPTTIDSRFLNHISFLCVNVISYCFMHKNWWCWFSMTNKGSYSSNIKTKVTDWLTFSQSLIHVARSQVK